MSKILCLLTFNLICLSSCLTTDNMHESPAEVVSTEQDSICLDIKTQNNELLKEKQVQLRLLREELTGSVEELQDKIKNEVTTLIDNPNQRDRYKNLSITMTIILTMLETSSQSEDSKYHNYSTYELLSMFYNNFYFSNSSYQSEVFKNTNTQIEHIMKLLEIDIRNLMEINSLLEETDSIK